MFIHSKFRFKGNRFRKHQLYIIHRGSNHLQFIFSCLNNTWKRTLFMPDRDQRLPYHLGRLCRLKPQSLKSTPNLIRSGVPTKLSRQLSRNQQENMTVMCPPQLQKLAVQLLLCKIQREHQLMPHLTHRTPKVRPSRHRSNNWCNR